jgi:hypothetical protein
MDDQAKDLYDTVQLEEKQFNKPHATKLYRQIIEEYPDSPYANQRRLDWPSWIGAFAAGDRTDCALGDRLQPQIAWAKFYAPCTDSAAIARKKLWIKFTSVCAG